MRRLARSFVSAAVLLATPILAHAQVFNPLASAASRGAIDLVKPIFDEGDFGAATMILKGTLFIPAGERGTVVARLPLVFATIEGAPSSTTLGNLELGLAVRTADGRPAGEFSVVLPSAQEFGDDDYATGVGFLSDIMHPDLYSSEVWSVNGAFLPSKELEGGGILGLRLGGSVWVPKNEGDTEFLGRYGAFFSRESGGTRFAVELNGLALLSESDLDFNQRTMHELGGAVGLVRDGVSPEFFVRFPIDKDAREVLTANVGVRLLF